MTEIKIFLSYAVFMQSRKVTVTGGGWWVAKVITNGREGAVVVQKTERFDRVILESGLTVNRSVDRQILSSFLYNI